jgi:hypothetical protein
MKSNFRNKKNNNLRVTLDTIHQEHVREFTEQEKSLPSLKKELKQLTLEISKQETQKSESKSEFKDEDYELYYENLKTKKEVEEKINLIKSNQKKIDYYLDVGDLLFQYYDKKKNPNLIKPNKLKNQTKHSIINFFNQESTHQQP